MSFYKNPKVDEYAKASEESVLAVRAIVCKRNGFIVREEVPDYGVDLEVEMIINADNATGKKFAIQIKSCQNISTVSKKKQKFVSYEFETSRLGYLSRRPPAYGLIIIYDDTQKTIFYDYVENIVNRLTEQKGNEEWKNQDNVNINIPFENILTNEKIGDIYQRYLDRFRNHDILIKTHGSRYGIPALSFLTAQKPHEFDLSNTGQIIEFLEKYGILLINKKDYDWLYQLLTGLTIAEIDNSIQLALLAALTYSEIGRFIEADYFIKRCFISFDDYKDGEKEVLNILRIRIDFAFGRLSAKAYLDKLVALEGDIKNGINQITIKIQIIYLKLLEELEIKKDSQYLLQEINAVSKNLDDIEIKEEDRHLLKISLSAYVFEIAIELLIHHVTQFRLREKFSIDTPLEQRINWFKETHPLFEYAMTNNYLAFKYSEKTNNKLLRAHSMYFLCYYFCGFELNATIMRIDKAEDEVSIKKEYLNKFNMALKSSNLFLELALLEEAHKALTTAYEIHRLFEFNFNDELAKNKVEDILEAVRKIEKDTGIKPFSSVVDEYVKDFERKLNDDPEAFYTNLTDNNINRFANHLLEVHSLPSDRFENIKLDIINHRIFYDERFCEELQLLQNIVHTKSKETMYKEKSKCIIVCVRCNIETVEGEDVIELLNSIDKDYCQILKNK